MLERFLNRCQLGLIPIVIRLIIFKPDIVQVSVKYIFPSAIWCLVVMHSVIVSNSVNDRDTRESLFHCIKCLLKNVSLLIPVIEGEVSLGQVMHHSVSSDYDRV